MTTYFRMKYGVSLKSRMRKIKCSERWPCKRPKCTGCTERRRSYFIKCGTEHAIAKGLTEHVVVSWIHQSKDDCDLWMRLASLAARLAKALSGCRAGPFIRVIAIGESRQTAHAHCLVSKSTALVIHQLAHRIWRSKVLVHMKTATTIPGLLGYFFDQNYRPGSNDPQRVKGIRLLSASRPMKTGHPARSKAKKVEQPLNYETSEHRNAPMPNEQIRNESVAMTDVFA